MRKVMHRYVLYPTFMLIGSVVAAAGDGLVARWSFDEGEGAVVRERVSQTQDSIHGVYRYVEGVEGSALRFDGYTTVVRRDSRQVPKLSDEFTVGAWVALETYPWTWCAVVDHQHNDQAGYYFAIDPEGRFGLHLSAEYAWQTPTSEQKLPLYQWNYIVGTYSIRNGVTLYLNGKAVQTWPIRGKLTVAEHTYLQIGRNNEPRALAHAVRRPLPSAFSRPLPMPISLDGIIDEVRIYSRALKAEEIQKLYAENKPSGPDPLNRPVLPTGPSGPGRFGAYYTRLKYTETWEAPWRVGEHPDVVVRFDEAPYKFIFWRGVRVPCWVTENGIWYSNEFFETWDADMNTGAEPLADKQTRFSHVRVIESHDARVVLHWRYAPVEIDYTLAHVDETGWGDWADEYYIIYPDGGSVRKLHAWSSKPHRTPEKPGAREFHESIIVNPPGTRPEDNIEMNALSLANLEGESHTYSWENGAPGFKAEHDKETIEWLGKFMPGLDHPGRRWLTKPANANIHLSHLKAKYSPYVIVDPKHTVMSAYGSDRSIFPWWNHWPVAQILSFGRYAVTPDRASHTSLTHMYWPPLEQTGNRITWVMFHGMTDKSAKDLVRLARSWLSAPKLEVTSSGFSNHGYDLTERAYVLHKSANGTSALEATLHASEQSPMVNVAIVVKGWGDRGAVLKIGGTYVPRGKDFRFGHIHRLEGSDLVLWIRKETISPMKFSLSVSKQ